MVQPVAHALFDVRPVAARAVRSSSNEADLNILDR